MTIAMDFLKRHPRLFDAAKRASRRLGRVNRLYLRLESEPSIRRPITFLQIGANDGMSCDPIREFVLRYGWRGAAVEPVPRAFALLQRNYGAYPDVSTVNCAVSYGRSPVLTLYCVSESALDKHAGYASMISSISRQHLERLLPALAPGDVEACAVPCVTVEQLLDRMDTPGVDFLHLDVEGHEANILLNMDIERARPGFILYEHVHLSAADTGAVADRLARKGFRLEVFDGDTLATRAP